MFVQQELVQCFSDSGGTSLRLRSAECLPRTSKLRTGKVRWIPWCFGEYEVETPEHPSLESLHNWGLHQVVDIWIAWLKSVRLFAMILTEAEKYHTLTAFPYPACATNGPSESSWHAWHVTRDYYQTLVEDFCWKQQKIDVLATSVLCSRPLNRQLV